MRMGFIYLYGPDGAGKSTQARILSSKLRKQGYRAKIVCIRSKHYPFRLFWNFLKIICGEKYAYPDGHITKIPRKKILSKLFSFIVWSDIFNVLILTFLAHIYLHLGYFIIAERFLIDTYADLLYFSKKFASKRLPSWITSNIFKFIPKCIFFFLDADYSSLCKRYDQRKSIHEPEDYIVLQRVIGKIFTRIFNGTRIFTPESHIIQTHILIFKKLKDNHLL